MLKNLLKKLVESIGGTQSIKLIDVLYGKKDVNEFLIAKKLNLTINQTRNLLYRLLNPGIISSKRKKDKRKGWYIYYWTLNIPKSLEILENKFSQDIFNLEKQLEIREQKRFYICAPCGIEVNEERALLNNFSCVECGEVYELGDNSGIIQETKKALDKLKSEMEIILSEKQKVDKSQQKKLMRMLEKEKAEKKAKRAANRISKKELKDKETLKTTKETSKKNIKDKKDNQKKQVKEKKIIKQTLKRDLKNLVKKSAKKIKTLKKSKK